MYLIKLREEQMKELYELKAVKKKPITKMVRESVDEYLKANKTPQGKEIR